MGDRQQIWGTRGMLGLWGIPWLAWELKVQLLRTSRYEGKLYLSQRIPQDGKITEWGLGAGLGTQHWVTVRGNGIGTSG